MGASLTMIDRHYGHLTRDGREHAIRLLDELSVGQRLRWTLVDTAWTSKRRRRLTAHVRRRLVDELVVGSLGSDDLPRRPGGVRHGVHFGAGEQGDRGGKR